MLFCYFLFFSYGSYAYNSFFLFFFFLLNIRINHVVSAPPSRRFNMYYGLHIFAWFSVRVLCRCCWCCLCAWKKIDVYKSYRMHTTKHYRLFLSAAWNMQQVDRNFPFFVTYTEQHDTHSYTHIRRHIQYAYKQTVADIIGWCAVLSTFKYLSLVAPFYYSKRQKVE